MTAAGKALAAMAIVGSLVAVRFGASRQAAVSRADDAAAAVLTANSLAHMDHRPRHGGLVLMRGDTHFETTIGRDGECRVFFTDATRVPRPASFASEVTIGLADGSGRKSIALRRDEKDQFWSGELGIISDPQTIVRIVYLAEGETPYWIDVPVAAWRPGN